MQHLVWWKTINGECVSSRSHSVCSLFHGIILPLTWNEWVGEKKNLSKVSEPRFRCKSFAWSLDNGFCLCSYICSLILSYFHNSVICSECKCILFLGDINTINDDDASGVISLVTVSQAGKFFSPAVFPTIACCWLGTEPRNTAWYTSL